MKEYRVKAGSHLRLRHTDPGDHHLCKDKESGKKQTGQLMEALDWLQEKLYVDHRHSLLIILQGMDTSGKDGTIRHVMSGVNPQSCEVTSFKAPTPAERERDFLWRIHQRVPPKGFVGIFNRSHYEDVLITRVHGQISTSEAQKRFKEINHFEKMLTSNGTTILKFYLHISKEEQRKRLQERADDPQKRWKLSLSDLAERKKWKRYQTAYQEALSATSTEHAPWYIVPSDHKWYRNWVVAKVIVKTLNDLDLRLPSIDPHIHYKKLQIR